jgi:hypothetical protein
VQLNASRGSEQSYQSTNSVIAVIDSLSALGRQAVDDLQILSVRDLEAPNCVAACKRGELQAMPVTQG